jgi:hypothetical protein
VNVSVPDQFALGTYLMVPSGLMLTAPLVGWVRATTFNASASASVSLANTSMFLVTSSPVVTVSAAALGVWLKNVENSRRTTARSAHNSGGSAGAVGPDPKNGDSNAATIEVATLTIAPGILITAF